MRADEPLKSKRVPISLAVWSTAFLTSTRLGSSTVSKLGIVSLFWSRRGNGNRRKFSHATRVGCQPETLQHLRPAGGGADAFSHHERCRRAPRRRPSDTRPRAEVH